MRIEEAVEAKRVEFESDGRRRLRILARFLREEVPEERFDLENWHTGEGCGFAACAVGWGMECPELVAEGLSRIGIAHGYTPHFDGWVHWAAVEAFFGVTPDRSEYLFNNRRYPKHPTPTEVAARIEAWLEAAG